VSDEFLDVIGRFEDSVVSEELLDIVDSNGRSDRAHYPSEAIIGLEGRIVT
jgi:hypothetical protein